MARKRTPPRGRGGRFVKKTRKNPRRRYSTRRRSTTAGMPRRTARRAYQTRGGAPLRRRRSRSNPRRTFTPATRYALWASGGAVAGFAADGWNIPGVTNLAAMIPARAVTNSTVLGVLALAASQFMLKGEAARNARAAGVGLLVPTIGGVIQNPSAAWGPKNGEAWAGSLRSMGAQAGGAHGNPSHVASHRLPSPARSCPSVNYSNSFIAASSGLNVA